MGTQPGDLDPIEQADKQIGKPSKRITQKMSEGVFIDAKARAKAKADAHHADAAKEREREAFQKAAISGLKHGEATTVLLEKLVNATHDPAAYEDRHDKSNKLRDIGAMDLFVETVVATMADRGDNNRPTKLALEGCALFFKVVFSPEMLKAANNLQRAQQGNLLLAQIDASTEAMAKRKAELLLKGANG